MALNRQHYPCGRSLNASMTRREMLDRCCNGFGALALMALMGDNPARSETSEGRIGESESGLQPTHFKAKAKNIIFLYMDGGPSQVDTFDPKPRLTREHGKPFGMTIQPTQFNNNGNTLASPWPFKAFGQSGLPVSSLFPHVARQIDDICVIRSMVSSFSEHTNANYFLHTGLGLVGRPSMGSWIHYGLGSENRDLPGFIVLNGGLIPPGGLENFGSGFLPAAFQGSVFKPSNPPVANIKPGDSDKAAQLEKLRLVRQLDRLTLLRWDHPDAVEAAILNQELAFRMQSAVPELMNLDGESARLRRAYGMESAYEPTRIFANQCLLARRLVERGVRFIELTCPNVNGDRWDQHGNLKDGHENNARAVDQPISALLGDLKARGLLETTLVVWAGEFGRTPFAQGSNGRDHNPFGFTLWMAGGGIQGGKAYGATDDYGYYAVENKVTIHDLHATMLHLLGINHKKLTFRHSGRDMRLTDVHGEILREILI